MKKVFSILGFAFIFIGFLGWRFDINTPFFPSSSYLIIGGATLAARIWGRVVSEYIMGFGVIGVIGSA